MPCSVSFNFKMLLTMTKTKTTVLRIRPLEYYFFGGESTFGNGEGASYFARSNPLPQQTSVLGLLRRLLFDAQKQIGDSFRADRNFKQAFGEIEGLSPVFLMDGDGVGWLPHALDAHSKTEKGCNTEDFATFNFSTARGLGDAFTGLGKNPAWAAAPYFENADSKKELTDLFISQLGKTCIREEVFKSFTRIGITKFRRGADPKTRTDAFYKQEMFKLTKGWSFAVVVELDDAFDTNLFNGKTVALGGEKSLARIEVVQPSGTFANVFKAEIMYRDRPTGQVVLLSDALVDDDFFEKCAAAIAKTTPFRNIITPQTPKSYGPMITATKQQAPPKELDKLFKTDKLTLLKSGSILFGGVGGTKAITDALEDAIHFQQIGYNHYFTF